MNDFLGFRKMITPLVIQIVFWIGVGVSVILGIGLMVAGAAASAEASRYGGGGYGGGIPGVSGGFLVLLGLLELFFGPVIVRINCELIILFFRIHETLEDIRVGGVPKPAPFAPTPVSADRAF